MLFISGTVVRRKRGYSWYVSSREVFFVICWVCNLRILKVYRLLLFQLSDGFPKPYPNEQAARAANVGKKCDM